MLTYIHIKNLIIIDELTLDLTPGLSVITGATGAGKSIWIDAVQLALGARADTSLIGAHADRGEITLCFDIKNMRTIQEWLEQQALDDHTECIIRRVIERNSRSRCMINGRPVGVSQLHELGQLALTIHSQHQQQILLKDEGQQNQVDQFAQLESQLLLTKQLFMQWQQLEQEKIALQNKLTHRETELEWLNYQLTEINELAPLAEEWQQLSSLHQELAHSEQCLHILANAIHLLSEDEERAIAPRLQQVQQDLTELQRYGTAISPITELLNQADIYLTEAISELQNLQSKIDTNPDKLRAIEQRLNKMHHLARKHHVEPESLWQIESQLAEKIYNLKQADEKIIELQKQQTLLLNQYQIVSQELSTQRQQAAQLISEKVTQLMQQLGMVGGRFIIKLISRETKIHPKGQEKVSFWVSTNPGQTPQILQKIVSGGELSRIHLALQTVIAKKTQIPTLIFDEIDVGISGQTAAIVGKLLRQLSQNTQVICITHQPQVAAYGNHHYQVNKESRDQHTVSQIERLDHAQRIEELARMLGGTQITQQARAHAEALLIEENLT